MKDSTVLVTGANGFVGCGLCASLRAVGCEVIRAVRRARAADELQIGDIDGGTDWKPALARPVDAVVHLAARVHVMRDESDSALEQYRRVNTQGTLNLARQCAARGVRRFVFVSTVKVLGEGRETPYQADDPAIPVDPYAISKWDAEQDLRRLAVQTGMEVVVVRPPLVYGPGVGANFLRLMRLVDRGLPIPLGAVDNRRSLVYLGNLVDAIRVCLIHPEAAGRTYLVSDGDDVSTPELIRCIASALERPASLLPVPPTVMRVVGRMLGKGAEVDRLLGSLTVDIEPIRRELEWRPPYSMQEGLRATAEWYRRV
jgi:nucleoside-diphosphate-sugar epimerase